MELSGEAMKDENREELEKLNKMSSYDRLRHLRKMALFYKSLGEKSAIITEVLLITNGY